MKHHPTNDRVLREQGQVGRASTTSDTDFTDLSATVKATLLKGSDVRLIDFAHGERSQVIGVIATLRDELPISCRWVTIRESHLSETRLRAKSYHIKGEHLRSEVSA